VFTSVESRHSLARDCPCVIGFLCCAALWRMRILILSVEYDTRTLTLLNMGLCHRQCEQVLPSLQYSIVEQILEQLHHFLYLHFLVIFT
jgi:hypothetical protein